jgi:DsbC/DsbD-like thiol-disulfide interchange protein
MRMLALLLIVALAEPAWAGETPWQDVAPGARARLISSDMLADGRTMVGLELDMAEGTNTYWRVPGETGIPTTFDFSASTGVTAHTPLWPYPEIETATGYVDFVYRGPTVLPVELTLAGERADVSLSVLMGICSDICVPVSAEFALPLDFASPDRAQSLRLQQAVAHTPLPWSAAHEAISWVGYDAATHALAVRLADPAVAPMSLIADPVEGGQLFGAPQKSPEPDLVLLPLLGGDEHRIGEGTPIRLTFMTDKGPFWVERQIASAGSTN